MAVSCFGSVTARMLSASCTGSGPPQVTRTENVSRPERSGARPLKTYLPSAVTGAPSISSGSSTTGSRVSHRRMHTPSACVSQVRISSFSPSMQRMATAPLPFFSCKL